MKQILLNIPENKYEVFLEAIKHLDFIIQNNINDIVVTDKEKELIRNRIRNSKTEEGQCWDKIKDSFVLD